MLPNTKHKDESLLTLVARLPLIGMSRCFHRLFMGGVLLLLMSFTGTGKLSGKPGKPGHPGRSFVSTTTEGFSCNNVAASVTIDNSIADGTTNDIVKIVITDQLTGLPVSNLKIQIATSAGVATPQTDGTGTILFGLGNTYITDIPFTIIVPNSCQPNISATFHYIPGPPNVNPPPNSPNPTYYITTIPTALANNSDTAVVKVHLTDGVNNEPAGYPVTFTVTSTTPASGTALLNTTTTTTITVPLGPDGSVDLPIKDINIGDVTIAASTLVNGVMTPIGTPQTVTFVVAPPVVNPPPGSSNPTYYTTIIASATADGSDTTVVQVHLTDGVNNEPAGYLVTFTITSTTPASGTALLNTTTTTTITVPLGPDGSVDLPITDLNTGSVTIAASTLVNGVATPIGTPQTVTFVIGPPVPGDPGGGGSGGTPPGGGGIPPPPGGGGGTPPGGGGTGPGGPGTVGGGTASNNGYTVLFVTQDFQLADGTHQDSVYAYITTAQKQPVPGASVKFFIQTTPTSGTATASAQLVGQPATTTDNNGLAAIGVVSTKPGTVFIDAILTVGGVDVLIDSSYRIVTFLNAPDVNNPLTNLSVVVYQALADGTQQTVVKAHIVDLDGTVMPDQEVTFTIDSGNAVIVTPQPVKTDANGDALIYITSKKPGDVLITATVNGQSIKFGSPARVKFVPINIYVPPVFTPNGDGVNDVLKPILVGIATFHYFSVYNRWGNLIYTSGDPNAGWDGRFKGVAQPVETYLWIAEGIDIQGKKIVQKGMTTLVR